MILKLYLLTLVFETFLWIWLMEFLYSLARFVQSVSPNSRNLTRIIRGNLHWLGSVRIPYLMKKLNELPKDD